MEVRQRRRLPRAQTEVIIRTTIRLKTIRSTNYGRCVVLWRIRVTFTTFTGTYGLRCSVHGTSGAVYAEYVRRMAIRAAILSNIIAAS